MKYMPSERAFNFTNIFDDFNLYEETKNEIKALILSDYAKRLKSVKVLVGDKAVSSTFGRVLINLLIMKPLVGKGFKLTKDDLFGYESVTEGTLNDYFNKLIIRCRGNERITYDELRELLTETINEMSDISGELNVLSGNSISFHEFVRLSATDPEAKALFNQKIDHNMQFDEIENRFEELGKSITSFYEKHKDAELYPFISSGTGINRKQLTQAIGFVGLKPDIDGSIIPVAISDNYLNGLGNLQSYFINSKGTRKALITNSRMVRRSGYLTRKLSLSMVDFYHDNTNVDCETAHFVNYAVDNEEKLYQIKNRHYYDLDAENNPVSELQTVSQNDKSLIGKMIGLRSPITCAADKVCRTCYGTELSEINKNLNTGLISVLFLTNPLTQKLLSAKHLLTTKTEKVNWGEDFSNMFSVNMNLIYFKDPEVTVSFTRSDVVYDDEDEFYFVEKIQISKNNKKLFDYISPVELVIDRDIIIKSDENANEDEDEKDRTIVIHARDYDIEPAFSFFAKNSELTKSLQEILDLVESSGHLGITTYHELANKFNDLLISNDLSVDSVHAEMIIAPLIRDVKTGKKLKFNKNKLKPYEIVRVSKSVMNAPLSVSFAFERLEDQLVDLKTYEKDEKSLMDYLYR
jgi:hypothetical protein